MFYSKHRMQIKLMKSVTFLKFSSSNVFMFTHNQLKKCAYYVCV